MAKLLIRTASLECRFIELKLGVNRIGRSSENDFQIEHPTISSTHCEIILADGSVTIRDTDSTNGTFVNGQTVKEAKLLAGQSVHLGDVELYVESTEVAVVIPKFDIERPSPPVVLTDGSMLCPRHPQSRVTHRCTQCHEVMCDACVHRLRRKGGKLMKLCPICSGPCEVIGESKKNRRSLLTMVKETVRLPFSRISRQRKD